MINPADDAGRAATEAQADPPADDAAPSAETSAWAGMLLAASMLLLTFTLMRATWKRRARRHAAGPDYDDEGERIMPGPVSSGSPELDRLEQAMADANELSRHIAATLDNRAVRLEILIEEADRKLAALEKAEGREP